MSLFRTVPGRPPHSLHIFSPSRKIRHLHGRPLLAPYVQRCAASLQLIAAFPPPASDAARHAQSHRKRSRLLPSLRQEIFHSDAPNGSISAFTCARSRHRYKISSSTLHHSLPPPPPLPSHFCASHPTNRRKQPLFSRHEHPPGVPSGTSFFHRHEIMQGPGLQKEI